jgi:hypothetical protein
MKRAAARRWAEGTERKDKESNWLPAAEGEFSVTMRIYWPKEKDPSILDGTWKPPAVKRVN